MLFRAIASGFLIATMVWLIPSAETAQFHVIVVMHISDRGGRFHAHRRRQRGSISPRAERSISECGRMIIDFVVPVLVGNIIGGTALFALIAYAQVMKEI